MTISVGLIGSCTNSSYEDMTRAASLAQQAADKGLKVRWGVRALGVARASVSGPERTRRRVIETPLLSFVHRNFTGRNDAESSHSCVSSPHHKRFTAYVLAGTCRSNPITDGVDRIRRDQVQTTNRPRAAQCLSFYHILDVQDTKKGDRNTIVSSYNRNFTGRNDANPATHAFVTSPEMERHVSGPPANRFRDHRSVDPKSSRLNFSNHLPNWNVKRLHQMTLYDQKSKCTTIISQLRSLPQVPCHLDNISNNMLIGKDTYQAPPANASGITVQVDPKSSRLQLLQPFAKWDGKDLEQMTLLIKIKGKCTTDHISAAGPWLKYRGHLDNISNNMFIGAVNAENGEVNKVMHRPSGQWDSVPAVARRYKAEHVAWCVVGDENYGEGSSREHAALEPRFLGGRAIIVKSFARIHGK
ncbi:Aconitase [Fasciola gigantica]|uniref:Aconitase n=1 Tax=Fasciola gigantica TaxID=46835 RepID=A0A504YTF7_FASGI|nr:Aconitase [Fasciola gigantica]